MSISMTMESATNTAIITSRWVFCWRFLFFLFRSTTNKTTKNNANTDQRMIFVDVFMFSLLLFCLPDGENEKPFIQYE